MQIIYRANDGKEFKTQAECEAHEASDAVRKARREARSSEDFRFMVLCAAKGNMAMYNLLRDPEFKE